MLAIFFTASWCSACKQMQPVIKRLQDKQYQINTIDFDSNTTLANEYKVKTLPTLIVFNGDKEIKRWTGIVSEEEIIQILKKIPDYKIW